MRGAFFPLSKNEAMKILIVEDEMAAARRLEKMILEAHPTAEILAQIDSVEAAVSWLSANAAADLIFMDIHLADGSAFEIFQHVRVEKPIIFTTAYDEYALQAFKVNAVDYLLKPIKQAELASSIKKFQKIFVEKTPAAPDYASLAEAIRQSEGQYLRRMLIKFGQSYKLVELPEVSYFYTKDKISFLVTRAGKRFPIDYPLDKLETMLDPRQFYRINRQFIVNVTAISAMHTYSKSRVKLDLEPPTGDMETIVSTERAADFKKWLIGER